MSHLILFCSDWTEWSIPLTVSNGSSISLSIFVWPVLHFPYTLHCTANPKGSYHGGNWIQSNLYFISYRFFAPEKNIRWRTYSRKPAVLYYYGWWFLGPTRSTNLNGSSVELAIFPEFTVIINRQTDTLTEHTDWLTDWLMSRMDRELHGWD